MGIALALALAILATMTGVALLLRRSFFQRSHRYQMVVALGTTIAAGATFATLAAFAVRGIG